MKLTTFIKAYKIALSNINDKVASWKSVYVGSILLPEKNDPRLAFIFSTGHDMQAGELAMSVSLNENSLDRLDNTSKGLDSVSEITKNALDKDVLAREYKSRCEKINEAGRFVIVLEVLLDRLKSVEPDSWSDSDVSEIYFDFNKDLAEFCINGSRVYTDGQLLLLGE